MNINSPIIGSNFFSAFSPLPTHTNSKNAIKFLSNSRTNSPIANSPYCSPLIAPLSNPSSPILPPIEGNEQNSSLMKRAFSMSNQLSEAMNALQSVKQTPGIPLTPTSSFTDLFRNRGLDSPVNIIDNNADASYSDTDALNPTTTPNKRKRHKPESSNNDDATFSNDRKLSPLIELASIVTKHGSTPPFAPYNSNKQTLNIHSPLLHLYNNSYPPSDLEIEQNNLAHPNSKIRYDQDYSKNETQKRNRGKVGGYKKRTLLNLLGDHRSHVLVNEIISWPEMNVVYYCNDWTQLFYKKHRLLLHDEHSFKKFLDFNHGSYTQSILELKSGLFILRQSRCSGIRACNICKTPTINRKPNCSFPECNGTIETTSCSVTLFYLFPSDPKCSKKADASDRRRFLVCIPDKGSSGHSHERPSDSIKHHKMQLFNDILEYSDK